MNIHGFTAYSRPAKTTDFSQKMEKRSCFERFMKNPQKPMNFQMKPWISKWNREFSNEPVNFNRKPWILTRDTRDFVHEPVNFHKPWICSHTNPWIFTWSREFPNEPVNFNPWIFTHCVCVCENSQAKIHGFIWKFTASCGNSRVCVRTNSRFVKIHGFMYKITGVTG